MKFKQGQYIRCTSYYRTSYAKVIDYNTRYLEIIWEDSPDRLVRYDFTQVHDIWIVMDFKVDNDYWFYKQLSNLL